MIYPDYGGDGLISHLVRSCASYGHTMKNVTDSFEMDGGTVTGWGGIRCSLCGFTISVLDIQNPKCAFLIPECADAIVVEKMVTPVDNKERCGLAEELAWKLYLKSHHGLSLLKSLDGVDPNEKDKFLGYAWVALRFFMDADPYDLRDVALEGKSTVRGVILEATKDE